MDKDVLEELLASISDELQQCKAMLLELLTWKSEIEEALTDVQSGGIMALMGKMLTK